MFSWYALITAGLIVWVGSVFLRHVAAVACRLREEREAAFAGQSQEVPEAGVEPSAYPDVLPAGARQDSGLKPSATGRGPDGIPVVGGSGVPGGVQR